MATTSPDGRQLTFQMTPGGIDRINRPRRVSVLTNCSSLVAPRSTTTASSLPTGGAANASTARVGPVTRVHAPLARSHFHTRVTSESRSLRAKIERPPLPYLAAVHRAGGSIFG